MKHKYKVGDRVRFVYMAGVDSSFKYLEGLVVEISDIDTVGMFRFLEPQSKSYYWARLECVEPEFSTVEDVSYLVGVR